MAKTAMKSPVRELELMERLDLGGPYGGEAKENGVPPREMLRLLQKNKLESESIRKECLLHIDSLLHLAAMLADK